MLTFYVLVVALSCRLCQSQQDSNADCGTKIYNYYGNGEVERSQIGPTGKPGKVGPKGETGEKGEQGDKVLLLIFL